MALSNRLILPSLLLALILSAHSAGNADPLPGENPILNKRVALSAGGFFPKIDSEIRLDSKRLGRGTTFDFEDELELEDSKETAWANFRWRISKRNNLEVEWVQLDRESESSQVSEAYQVGDTVIQAGGRINTRFDLDIYRVTYGYSLLRSDRSEMQLLAGVHLAEIDTELQLTGAISVNGDVFSDSATTEGTDLTAPLPHVGASYTHAFSDKLAFYGNLIGFALEVDDVEGSVIEVGGTLQWNFTPHFGLGAGARYFRVDVKAEEEDLRGKFEFDYFGPVLYASLAF